MAEMKGGCPCGAVQFTAARVETGFEACHCGMCPRGYDFAGNLSKQTEAEFLAKL